MHLTLSFPWGSSPFQPAGRGKEEGRACLESFAGPGLEAVHHLLVPSHWLELSHMADRMAGRANISVL